MQRGLYIPLLASMSISLLISLVVLQSLTIVAVLFKINRLELAIANEIIKVIAAKGLIVLCTLNESLYLFFCEAVNAYLNTENVPQVIQLETLHTAGEKAKTVFLSVSK